MKSIIILIFYVLLISCQSKDKADTSFPISVSTELIRSYESADFDSTKRQAYDLKISINNTSDKPVTFWTMKCSVTDNFILSKFNYHFRGTVCDSNFPVTTHLNPTESITYHTVILSGDNVNYLNENKLKVGFIYFDTVSTKSHADFRNSMGDMSKWKIIWSPPVDIR